MTQKIVMHIIASNFFGGPEKQIVNHGVTINNEKWKFIVCSLLEGRERVDLLEAAEEMGLESCALKTKHVYNPLVLLELVKLIRSKNPAVIAVHGYRPLIFCMLLKIFHKKPVLAFSRGYTAENVKTSFFEIMDRIFLSYSNLIIAVSEGQKKLLMNYGLRGDNIRVVRNAVSLKNKIKGNKDDFKKAIFKEFDIPEGAMLVISAGRLSPEKGHSCLLDAIHNMGDKAEGVCFVFCGEGQCKEALEEQARKLNITDKCRFVGFRNDINEIFSVMDLMVLPSLTEGLPNVALEAFACKKPVVATSVGGVPEIVEDRKNGYLTPANRPDLLAEAIAKCLSSADERSNMGEAGYRKVKTEFSFEEQTRKLEGIYQELLN